MPRSVRILEGPLFGGTWIVAAFAETRIVETRIVLSGTRVAFGSPRSATIIRDWAVAAHSVIVLDRPVAVRYGTAIVDWSIAEALTGFTACTVVSEARILSGWCLTLVSDPRVVGNGRLLALWWLALLRLALWWLTLIGESRIVGHWWLIGNRWLLTCWRLTLISDARIVGDRRLLPLRCLTLRCLTLVGNRTTVPNWATIGNRTTVTNWATVIDGALLGCTGIVSCVALIADGTAVVDWPWLFSDPRIVARRLLTVRSLTLSSNWTTIGNRTTIANWAAVIDGTLLGCTRVVACVTLVRNWSTVVMTVIGNGLTVMVTVVVVTVVTSRCSGACTCGSSRTGSSGTCGCTGCGLVVAVSVHVGIKFIGALELAFLLQTLLLGETIAFSGVSVQLLSLGGLAFGFSCLHFGVGVSLLRLCLAMLGVGFAGMDFMLGFGCLLTDPCCFLALVFALLSCGLTTDRNDDADDNQNNDDRYDYPDNGSCIHALSPCCLFGSH
ncbi:hypothetical protein [Brevibacterium zhoupengii]|uniref:hypothetical protein n=1 Tax=Brevibacterium zhoupengii TaxID=2898795 RepID=UPI001E5F2AF2|nr:hypothetical protein [Brevibacterium zhoupengii]